MSETKGQNNKLPEDKGAGPTRSFDGSIVVIAVYWYIIDKRSCKGIENRGMKLS